VMSQTQGSEQHKSEPIKYESNSDVEWFGEIDKE
jgi:hypothetical protein